MHGHQTLLSSILHAIMLRLFLLMIGLISNIGNVNSLAVLPEKKTDGAPSSRRAFLAAATTSTASAFLSVPDVSHAASRLVLNEDGEYEEVEEGDWQSTWKERLDKAQSMDRDAIFMAARGAGNTSLKEGPESDASKKRRAMAGCRDAGIRQRAGVKDAKECTARVLNDGNVEFILNVMQ